MAHRLRVFGPRSGPRSLAQDSQFAMSMVVVVVAQADAGKRLDRVGKIEEPDLEAEALAEEFAQRAHAEPLGRVVSRREEVHPVLERTMLDPLARLAGDEGVEPGGHRLVERRLAPRR